MTYSAPSCDFYDDGLVHAHEWSRSTPPGGKHGERPHTPRAHEREDHAAQDRPRAA